MKSILILLFSLALVICQAEEVKFHKGDLASALAKAKKANKPLVIDAYTDWCGPCKMLDKQVFQDENAGEYINKHFVAYKLDMEKGEGPYVAMKFRVNAYPTTLFISADGKLLSKDVGYPGKDGYLEWCKAVVDGEKKAYASLDANKLKLPYPDFYKNSFTSDQWERQRATVDEVNSYLKAQKDLSSEVNFSVMKAMAYTGHDYLPWVMTHADELKAKYPDEEVDELIQAHVARSVGSLRGEDVDVSRMEKRIDMVFDSLDLKMENPMREKMLIDLWYYQKQYGQLLKVSEKNKEYDTPGFINTISWGIYEESDDASLIKHAIGRMHRAIEEDPDPAYIDTLAHLYFKDGQKDNARKYAKMALEKAKEQGMEMEETEELLEKLEG